jgi:hypothetical protein
MNVDLRAKIRKTLRSEPHGAELATISRAAAPMSSAVTNAGVTMCSSPCRQLPISRWRSRLRRGRDYVGAFASGFADCCSTRSIFPLASVSGRMESSAGF